MHHTTTPTLAETTRDAAHPLTGAKDDYDPLLDLVGDAHVVLLGEASHGTHEFYRERARITRRLIEEKGFGAFEPCFRVESRPGSCVTGIWRRPWRPSSPTSTGGGAEPES